GFKDQSYFTKVFRKETGLSPRQFRIRTSTLPRPAHRRPYKRRNKDGTVDENIGATAEASAPDAEAAKPKKGKKAKAAKEPPKGKAEPKQKKPNKPKKSKSQKAK
ncbi:MAG: AraC family transcriptional regulator, partial [Oscillospiraceae bacterium]|nr:AraC family transcriptional regulator [Oscillospiraceae bacterium]